MMSLPRDLIHEKLPNASSTLASISYQHALKEMTAQKYSTEFFAQFAPIFNAEYSK